MADHYLGLPPIPRETFNTIAQRLKGGVCWTSDQTNPGQIDPEEIGACRTGQKLNGFVSDNQFTTRFARYYQRVAQAHRRELVKKELDRTSVTRITVDLNKYQLTRTQKQMVADIFEAGQAMETLYQIQRGALAHKPSIDRHGTKGDKEFYRRYQTVWCDDMSNPYCNAAPSLPNFSTPLYPDQIDCKAMTDELANPFSVVRQDVTGKLRAIPYAEDPELKYLQAEAAAKANRAAVSADRAGEPLIANYLREVGLALQSKKPFPYVKADEAWIASKNSRFYLRFGADEYQDDKACGIRAQFHMVVGIKDTDAEKNIGGFVARKQEYEQYLAKLVPGYRAREIAIETPDFMNVIMEFGDARGNTKGTPVGQTLPNWCGEDGKGECPSRIMIFTNKTQRAYSQKMVDAFAKIFSKNILDQLDTEELLNTIVHHELAHNLGLQNKDFSASLGDMLGRMEELKAEVGALTLRPILEQTGQANPQKRKGAYAGLLLWCMGHIRRSAYRGEKFYETKSPYQQLAAVIVGYFTKKGAFTYQDGVWDINYDQCQKAAESLYTELCGIYQTGKRQAVADWFMKYTSGLGLQPLHLDRLNETVAKVPSTLFSYRIVGWRGPQRRPVAAPLVGDILHRGGSTSASF